MAMCVVHGISDTGGRGALDNTWPWMAVSPLSLFLITDKNASFRLFPAFKLTDAGKLPPALANVGNGGWAFFFLFWENDICGRRGNSECI